MNKRQVAVGEPNSDTCYLSPTRNDCRKAEPGGGLLNVTHLGGLLKYYYRKGCVF